MCSNLASIAKVPIVLTISFIFLFIYLGVSFLAGIGVFIFSMGISFFFGVIKQKLSYKFMKKKDDRMNITTEVINNIKMIKLYSWSDTFKHRINEKRDIELG